jgi:protein ImuB
VEISEAFWVFAGFDRHCAMVQAEQGCPREISAWDKNKSVYGKVVCMAGPWRTSGDWWRSDRWARDEWDVAIESMQSSESHTSLKMSVKIGNRHGAPRPQVLYRIYRELSSGTWFVEGVYD